MKPSSVGKLKQTLSSSLLEQNYPGLLPRHVAVPCYRHVQHHLETQSSKLPWFRPLTSDLSEGALVQIDSFTSLGNEHEHGKEGRSIKNHSHEPSSSSSSSSSPKIKRISFAGIVMKIYGKGLHTTVVVRHCIMKSFIEQSFPIYSPMVQHIHVLKRKNELKKIPKNVSVLRTPEYIKKFNWSSIQALVKEHGILLQQPSSSSSSSSSTSSSTSTSSNKK
ncbi:hypothetical protein HMI54_007834 [Coelomomyces lativittatus]|nr:hypothetical protein HMI56_007709 [Coelomomyces lativittatus]KAJ1511350.1 hypothetical protein HMI55_006632 [Coelomomyces lativittatus]KAJ1516883.1 hypothetical protein HMI54_007834 [Coelomomyces lativittatus]